jgi:demethylmenaquinone methyltransferase/2-methoxy-6-polyprenyl-1,4-benzoquinol methylase
MGKMSTSYPLREYYGDIYTSYDRVNRIFTFGRDRAWRKRAVEACLRSEPRSVLDLCTGTGDFILEVARQAQEGMPLTGYDFSAEMLELARLKNRELSDVQGIPEIEFMEGDANNMPFKDGAFDAVGITFGIRNLIYQNSHAEKHLSEIRRVLRKAGRLIVLESSKPSNIIWRFFNTLYLQFILPYLGGVISGNLNAYRYLARSSKNYYSIREMSNILKGAGFIVVESRPLFLGSVMLVVAEKN